MAEQILSAKLKLRTDLASNWTTSNPTLLAGELGLESDTKKIKIGDGTKAWNSLEYWGGGSGGGTSDYDDLENSPILNVTELPSASSASDVIYNLSGIYYISNGTAWEQVAPLPDNLVYGENSEGATTLPENIDADTLGGYDASHFLDYNNLTNKPSSTSSTLTIKKNGNLVGTYDGTSATEVNITTPSVHYFTAEVPATGWTATAPYTVDVNIPGLLTTDRPLVIPTYTGEASVVANQIKAWSCITRMSTGTNTLTMYAYTKAPTVAVPIQLQVIREG